MPYEPKCGGGGDCAHAYMLIDAGSIRCRYCGHGSRTANHRWMDGPGGSYLCVECYALQWPPGHYPGTQVHLSLSRAFWLWLALATTFQLFLLIHTKDTLPREGQLYPPFLELGHNLVPLAVVVNGVLAVIIIVASFRLVPTPHWPRPALALTGAAVMISSLRTATQIEPRAGVVGVTVLAISVVQVLLAALGILLMFSSTSNPIPGTKELINRASRFPVSLPIKLVLTGSTLAIFGFLTLYYAQFNYLGPAGALEKLIEYV